MPPFEQAYGVPDAAAASGFSLSANRQSVIVSLLSAGSFAGALLGVPFADLAGRRGAIFGASAIFSVGVIVQVAPYQNYGAFLAGRFIAGMGVGALSALVPLYMGEVSPKGLRGALVSSYQIMITLGILIAYCAVYGTKDYATSASYRVPIGIQLAWSMILCSGTPFLPRSPRESMLRGNEDAARHTVARMHAVDDNDPIVDAIIEEIRIRNAEESSSSYLECFNFRSKLKTGQRTLIGCCVQSFQQLTGANFIFYYGTSVFASINTSLDSYVSQIIFGTLDVVGTIPGLYCLDRFGRRRTMITGALVMGFAYLCYACIGRYALYPDNNANLPANKGAGAGMITVIAIFVLGYGCSWGPGGWVNTGEIAPLRTKSKQLSFVAASNWTWNFLLSYFSLRFLFAPATAGSDIDLNKQPSLPMTLDPCTAWFSLVQTC